MKVRAIVEPGARRDSAGRIQFTLEWERDGRRRAQVFFTNLDEYRAEQARHGLSIEVLAGTP